MAFKRHKPGLQTELVKVVSVVEMIVLFHVIIFHKTVASSPCSAQTLGIFHQSVCAMSNAFLATKFDDIFRSYIL